MNRQHQEEMTAAIRAFRLPRYEEIPNVGLYLEQAAKYINEYLLPLQEGGITGSMISNYVKKHLVANPVKKQYDRDQIAYLLFISVVKGVLSLDNVGTLLEIQKKDYPSQVAYNYFCTELEQVLQAVFGLGDALPVLAPDADTGKVLLHNVVITVAHKIYLEKCFGALGAEAAEVPPEA